MCAITAKRFIATESVAAPSSSELHRPTKRRRPDEVPASISPSPSLNSLTGRSAQRSTSSPSPSPVPRPNKRVSFSPSQPSVAPPARWIDDDPSTSWYGGLDFALFKLQEGTDAALVRCHLEAASFHPEREDLIDVSAYRGLERLLTPQMTVDVKRRRREVATSVLLEQRRQRTSGLKDEVALAGASRRHSEKAAVWARTLGSL